MARHDYIADSKSIDKGIMCNELVYAPLSKAGWMRHILSNCSTKGYITNKIPEDKDMKVLYIKEWLQNDGSI